MFAKLLAFGTSNFFSIKAVFGIITFIAFLASLYAIVDHFESKGYNRAIIELQSRANEEIQKAIKEAIKQATKENQKALDRQRLVNDAEAVRVKGERIIEIKTKEVIRYVDKIKIKNECLFVDDSIIGLLNESISNSNLPQN